MDDWLCEVNQSGVSFLVVMWNLDVGVLVKRRSPVCHRADGEYLLYCLSLLFSTCWFCPAYQM